MTTKKTQKAPIDREAEEAQVIDQQPVEAEAGEPLMPTAENAPPCLYRPGNGVTSTDVLEIAVMYLLQLSNSDAQFAPGALRTLPLNADRVAMLSEQSRQWFKPIGAAQPQA